MNFERYINNVKEGKEIERERIKIKYVKNKNYLKNS